MEYSTTIKSNNTFSLSVQAMTLAASGDEVAQEAAAECFCSAASFDGGRALLGPVVESGVIFALMESKSQAARSAAARQVWWQCLDRVWALDGYFAGINSIGGGICVCRTRTLKKKSLFTDGAISVQRHQLHNSMTIYSSAREEAGGTRVFPAAVTAVFLIERL